MDLKGTVPISPGDSARPDCLKSGQRDESQQNGDCTLVPAREDYLLTRLGVLVSFFRRWGVDWCRRNSLWPLPFATACCGIELMSTGASRYDLARFGAEVMRFSPRQADLLIVAGRVATKMMPVLQRVYRQMCEPKWVISMGACASTGGVFDNYAVVQGIDQFMPVDVYVPGCPPRPETLIEGVMAIQRLIDGDCPHFAPE